MPEQLGKIHGIISREEAWKMWPPYGERVVGDLDGSFDADTLTPSEVTAIAWGAHPQDRWDLYHELPLPDGVASVYDDPDWIGTIVNGVVGKSSTRFLQLLEKSNSKQNKNMAEAREVTIARGPEYVRGFGEALVKIAEDGVISPSDAGMLRDRLTAPDGTPYMQYTPMTPLEARRIVKKWDGKEQTTVTTDFIDFGHGVIVSGQCHSGEFEFTTHNRVHEHDHLVSGVELYDVTMVDGVRMPAAQAVGHFNQEVTTVYSGNDDYKAVKTFELGEGWTDGLAVSLMKVDPELGRVHKWPDDYQKFTQITSALASASPDLRRVIQRAAIVDATPSDPFAKQDAFDAMNTIGDDYLGLPDSLNRIYKFSAPKIASILGFSIK